MSVVLPYTNEDGYYEIRLESIGGLGANLCGKLLGELGALYLSLNASSFSSYGSEKRGSPVKSYIRWCSDHKEIRVNSPVEHPHILCIFHEGLLDKHPVLSGITENTIIILNTVLTAKKATQKWKFQAGTLYCIDAQSIALSTHARINMIMLGAIAKASKFIPITDIKNLCSNSLGKKYPSLLNANLTGINKGFHQLSEAINMNPTEQNSITSQTTGSSSSSVIWGYENAPIGGINPRIGSTVLNDLSPSREGYIPVFIKERCINCGLCDSTCPDMVFQFKQDIYNGEECMVNQGLDYYHCKGCLRCVEVCPTNALIQALEKDFSEKPYFVPNKDLRSGTVPYIPSGPDSYVNSESFLEEKRVDGGVV